MNISQAVPLFKVMYDLPKSKSNFTHILRHLRMTAGRNGMGIWEGG